MKQLWNRVNHLVARAAGATRREEGQTMVEYGLIIALIALAVVGTILIIGQDLNNVFNNVVDQIKTIAP